MKPTWTPSAAQSLERFLDEVRRESAATGVDAEEVAADLRHHIDEELARTGITVVTDADVQRLIARVRPVPENPGPATTGSPAEAPIPASPPGPAKQTTVLILGVVLPLITMMIELFAGWCAEEFFDPLPTALHVVLAMAVPLSNLALWIWMQRSETGIPAWLWHLNALGAGVAAFYTALFLPSVPFALIGIVFFGLGLLPLTPLFSLVSSLLLRKWAKRKMGPGVPALPRGWAWTFLAPIALLAAYSIPSLATRHYAQIAVSDSPGATDAVRWLRRWGDRDLLLRDSYGQRRGTMEELLARPVGEMRSRELYFRVTGHPFNAVKPPASLQSRRNRFALDEWEFPGADWDGALGGEAVAGRVRGLSLAGSRLDGIVGADEGTSYTEWTLEFRNDHETRTHEARAQIQLPPGGIVSRLTLWVNGEEREAAFAGRAQVREAYQQVAVVERRDPVLVSTSGPDRILVQCFPVPPRGGTMKVRFGITAPLMLETREEGIYQWPQIVERNFGLGASLAHSVWLEASQALSAKSPKLKPDTLKPGRPGIHGTLTDAELADGTSAVHVSRNPAANLAWAEDERNADGSIVRQRIVDVPATIPRRIAFVVDGSATMEKEFAVIAESLEQLGTAPEVAVFLAIDGVRGHFGKDATADRWGVVRHLRGNGGQDNVPALREAWDWAAGQPDGIVLWVHGPQPVMLTGAEVLQQRLQWRSGPGAPVVHDLQTRPGPNRVVEQLDATDLWQAVPRLGALKEDLDRLVHRWSATPRGIAFVRERVSGGATAEDRAAKHGSSHLARLWAADEVRRLMRARRTEEAAKLGAQYQLVTGASGAVVLENRQQYQQSGLQPVHPSTVPIVPEPGTVALLVTGGGCLLLMLAGRRRARG